MSDELEKRASDAEREQAVVRLREASTEGRLGEAKRRGRWRIADRTNVVMGIGDGAEADRDRGSADR